MTKCHSIPKWRRPAEEVAKWELYEPGDLVVDRYSKLRETYGMIGIVLRKAVENSKWVATYVEDEDYVYDILFVGGRVETYHSMFLKRLA